MRDWFENVKSKAAAIRNDTYALYYAYRDPRTPWGARLFAACVVAYAFSPIDLIPDFIPVLGYLDDLVLIPAGIVVALRMIPAAVVADAREKAESALREKKPVNWAAGAAIVLIWLGIAYWVVRQIFFD